MSTRDLADLTPEGFTELVANSSDAELADTVHELGTEAVLDRVFDAMEERFVPERADGVDATTDFVIRDEGEEHHYVVRIVDGTCSVSRGQTENPTVRITTDLVSFCKLITGRAAGPMLFMSGKLKLSGDIMFAPRLLAFFDRPSA